MREPKDTDFLIDLEGVGKFRFARRTFNDRIKIRGEIAVMSRDFGDDLDTVAEVTVLAVYKTLVVACPKGWEDLGGVDLVDRPEVEEQAWQLFMKLQDAESRFRQDRDEARQKDGQGDVAVDPVLVSPKVSPTAK
ncbi:hypothetical protein [Propionivibrio sp.]|uniref:hypothetical protein n=1 Tax=Propionivibrio sp. TaxID=2212460 RepID=UPI003BF349B0